MITTFAVARWAVRATLLAALLGAALRVFNVPMVLLLPSIAGLSKAGQVKSVLLRAAPDLFYFGILLLLSDLLANVVVGGDAVMHEPLQETRQLRAMLPGLLGLLLALPALPTLIFSCAIIVSDLAQHAWSWPNLWVDWLWSSNQIRALSYHTQIVTLVPALLHVFVGAALLFWRRVRQIAAPIAG